MATKNKEKFTTKINDEEVVLAVKKPDQAVLDKAQRFYNKKYRELVECGTLIKAQADQLIKSRGLWNDELEGEFNTLRDKLREESLKLAKGGVKLSEGYKLAIQMIKDRNRLLELSLTRSSLDGQTAEYQAENYRFSYLVSACTVYDMDGKSGDRVFESFDDYLEKLDQPYAQEAGNKLAYLVNDLTDFKATLPENKFLVKYGYMNKEYRLVDKKGRLTNEEGKHIDENGNYIKWTNETEFIFVDVKGNPVDKEGNYIVEEAPFIDDETEMPLATI